MMLQLPAPPEHVRIVFMPAIEKPFYTEADFWVAIGTVLLACITAWLAWETRELRRDGAEGVKAAGRSAAAAEKSAAIAREAMQRTLRAYVVVKEIKFFISDLGLPRSVTVRIVNTGQTPSQSQYCFCKVERLDLMPIKSEFDIKQNPHDIRDVLGIDQTRDITREITYPSISDAAIAAIKTQELVLHGLIKYQDIFSDEPHFTAFCYVFDFQYSEWVPRGPLNYVL